MNRIGSLDCQCENVPTAMAKPIAPVTPTKVFAFQFMIDDARVVLLHAVCRTSWGDGAITYLIYQPVEVLTKDYVGNRSVGVRQVVAARLRLTLGLAQSEINRTIRFHCVFKYLGQISERRLHGSALALNRDAAP